MKRLLILGGVICAVAVAWRFSPIGPEELLHRAQSLRHVPGAMFWVPAAYVVGGLVMFPFTALRLGTILVFGPLLGIVYALVGAAASALVGHAVGRKVGGDSLLRVLGPRGEKLRALLARRGALSVAAARLLPLGPYMLVNAFAGAARIPRRDFVFGTLLATLPGLLIMAFASGTISRFLG